MGKSNYDKTKCWAPLTLLLEKKKKKTKDTVKAEKIWQDYMNITKGCQLPHLVLVSAMEENLWPTALQHSEMTFLHQLEYVSNIFLSRVISDQHEYL